jgi:hypothetical protein
MTPSKKISLVAIGLMMVVLILRETEFLDLNLYHSEATSSLNSNISSKTSTVNFEGQKAKPVSSWAPADLSFIVILEKDTLYKEMNSLEPIIVRIDSLTSGPIWMPLYKSVQFSAVVSHHLPFVQTKPNHVPGYTNVSLSGNLKIAGEIQIQGLCSRKEVRKLIRNYVVENVTRSTKEYFADSSPEFLQGIAMFSKVPAGLVKL